MLGVDPVISSLSTFTGTSFFLGDEMHLIGRGLGTLVYNLLDPKKNKKFREFITQDAQYTFGLNARDDTIIKKIDEKVKQSRVYIPSAFEGTWDGGVGIGRAVDYLDFLLYIVPTIVLPLVQNNETKCALMELVEGCSIALQWRISRRDITKMKG